MKARRWIVWTGASPSPDFQQRAGHEPTKLTKQQLCQFSQFAPGERAKITRLDVGLEPHTVDAAGVPWADWKARTLNHLFEEQGTTGERGRITATTILHGMSRLGTAWGHAKGLL
jgi:hypothetical protein